MRCCFRAVLSSLLLCYILYMYWSQFLTIAIIHFLAVASPGPDFAVVTSNSLLHSRKSGIYTTLGIALGLAVHITYCILGIAIVISKSIILFNIIKYLGAGYLIYIGYKSMRAKPAPALETEETEKPKKNLSPLAAIRIGFLTNVLNPKATLFMLALFTQVITPGTPKGIEMLYGLEMMTATFLWFSLLSVFFSHKQIRIRVAKFQHKIERVTGVVLIALGIKVALASHR